MSHRASRPMARPFTQHTPTPTRMPDRRRPDRGMTLIEIVVAVTLMSIVVGAILSAVATTISASATSRSAAQIETALVNAADRVNRAPKRCDYTMYARAAVQAQDWPVSTVTVAHQYYVPGATATSTGSWVVGPPSAPGCSGAAPSDLLVQRVTVSLTSPDGKIHRSIDVVKSDV